MPDKKDEWMAKDVIIDCKCGARGYALALTPHFCKKCGADLWEVEEKYTSEVCLICLKKKGATQTEMGVALKSEKFVSKRRCPSCGEEILVKEV